MSFKHRGDTLVEVLFAFAILSLVMSTAFSGALSAYKSSLAAQNQTQANFVAQYQAEALKTYRDALEWDSAIYPSFLTGFAPASGEGLPAMTSYLNQPTNFFCMVLEEPSDRTAYWKVEEDDAICNQKLNELVPELGSSAKIQITLTTADIRSPNQVTANIEVIWTPRNSRVEQSVVNSVLLTK